MINFSIFNNHFKILALAYLQYKIKNFMKKFLLLSLITCLSIVTKAQFVTIPDIKFKAALLANSSINTNMDSQIQVSEASAYNGMINVSNDSITDLTGIEIFTAIVDLRCSDNFLTNLNITSNTALVYLDCNHNQLTGLDVSSNTALKNLYCNFNQLTSLNISSNTALTHLECYVNQLTSLDVSTNTSLNFLQFSTNQIASIDVSTNTALSTLYCNGNLLTSLNLTTNTALTVIDCSFNPITSLNLSTNTVLNHLACIGDALTALDVSLNTALDFLSCYSNQLTSLNIKNGNNINLTIFQAFGNPNLNCILVDNVNYMNTNWSASKDPIAGYSQNCSCVIPIPDPRFRNYLLSDASININGDGVIQCSEASGFTGVINVNNDTIGNLTGIQAFTALTILACSDNPIHNLDVSANTALKELYCSRDSLTTLDITANIALTSFASEQNFFTTIDVSNNTALTYLNLHWNQLNNINILANTALTNIDLGNNNALSSLDVSANTALMYLSAMNDNLSSLNVSNNTNLKDIAVFGNAITSLDVTANLALTGLDVAYNQLTSLNVKNGQNANITYFRAIDNPNLTCIQVDNPAFSDTSWTNINGMEAFSTNCALVPVAGFYNAPTACLNTSVNFNDSSTNSPATWSWSFQGGTPSSSALQNPIVSFNNPGMHIVSLTVSNIYGSNTKTDSILMNTVPYVYLGSDTVVCSGTNMVLTANGGVSYMWCTSETTPSISVNPSSTTTYFVTVTAINGCAASDTVVINTIASTDIFGHVTYSGFDLTSGNAIIYKYQNTFTHFDTVQINSIDGYGHFQFASIPAGNYIIKIYPNPSVFPTLIPTYFGNKFMWDSAAVLLHGCGMIDTANITMVEQTPGSNAGPGIISGQIKEGPGFVRAEGDPIPGVDVKLGKNPGNQIVASTYTDSNGQFSFNNVDIANYTIYVDITGLIDSTYTVNVDGTNNVFSGIIFTADSSSVYVTTGTGLVNLDSKNNATVCNIYPNPYYGSTQISYELSQKGIVCIDVYNAMGQKLKTLVNASQTEGKYNYTFSAQKEGFDAGIYFVKLIVDGKSTLKKIVELK
jgi:PKD repeat protein